MKSRILPILLLGLIILLAWVVAQPPGTVGTVPPIATAMSNALPVYCVAGQLYFLPTTNTLGDLTESHSNRDRIFHERRNRDRGDFDGILKTRGMLRGMIAYDHR